MEVDNMKEKKDIIVNGRSLKDILDLHELFLISKGKEGERANLEYVNLEGANLEYANLKYAILYNTNLEDANLEGANLFNAYLKGANLFNAYLNYANLECANLYNANLKYANLYNANLYNANLFNAYLKGANLKYAYLASANLECANLEGAYLKRANLFRANLVGVNLENVIYDHTTLFYTLQCPEKGNFIAYKKAGKCIVELEILENSKRSSATTRKCRCDKARVISIENIETGEKVIEVSSNRDESFVYKVGEMVSVDDFNEDRWVECTTGIHFFMTKHEAESYDE